MGLLLKLLFLGAIVVSAMLLWLQNQQPISLTLFAVYRTPSLGLGVWMLLFTLGGVFTSWCLRLPLYLSGPSKERVKTKVPPKQTPEPWEQADIPREIPKQTPEPWEQADIPRETPEQTPETKTDTTYSYSYVKAPPKQQQNKTDQVYDAPYRIITPPSDPDPEDEDWV
ncbi:hypothetical protein [Gloeocapsa sp. PCC 73106]|uniref:hypothetical protein n=1 Tax=Gloeocapsa sp. PCC 73106 TaxID=102232 RepID=UPI0002ACC333|nr:hypothetical protein [Gloeocapsa sp. PCC 73106]ELR98286.1 Protein of unknown function (DUF1049) [Gloeocapsa sp. PCC 73106]